MRRLVLLISIVMAIAKGGSGAIVAPPPINRVLGFTTDLGVGAGTVPGFLSFERNKEYARTNQPFGYWWQYKTSGTIQVGDDRSPLYYVANYNYPIGLSESTYEFDASGYAMRIRKPLNLTKPDFDTIDLNLNATSKGMYTGVGPGFALLSDFQEITWKDIAMNKKSLQMPVVYGGRIEAKFTPHTKIGGQDTPVDLKVAAGLLGVDHFNWKNTVTIPAEYAISLDLDGIEQTTRDRTPVNMRIQIDPIQNPVSRYAYTIQNDIIDPRMRSLFVGLLGVTPDLYPYYWNENDASDIGINDPTITTVDSLLFEDTPSSPVWFDENGTMLPELREVRYFKTELFGVMTDKTEVKTGLSFVWKSDAKYFIDPELIVSGQAELISYQVTRNTGQLPEIIAGGVFDVEVFQVPEPSAFTLFGILLLSLCASRRVKRQ